MTLERTDTFLDVDRPDGERLRVKFRGVAASDPIVSAGLLQLLLEASDGNVYQAVTAYANGLSLGATYYLGSESVIIEIYSPPTLTPLVNASGGSPGSNGGRRQADARSPVPRPLARLRRHRATSG